MMNLYFRPQTLDEALKLLSEPNTIPLGGGTKVNTPGFHEFWKSLNGNSEFSVVDLQALGLSRIRKHGNLLEVGACTTLQELFENPHTPEALKRSIKLESPLNIRNVASVAGSLVSCDGRSPFTTAMLGLDSQLTLMPGEEEIALGNTLPLRSTLPTGKLIASVSIPLNANLAFDYVARSPSDRPIVCVAVAKWASGRTRLALGGYGQAPLLALDGTENDDIQAAARNAFHEAFDEWASTEYRSETAAVLSIRCIEALGSSHG